MVIIVLWMDGLTETYPFTSYDTEDGQLNIYRHSDSAELLLDERHIPLVNIRVWKPDRRQVS